MFSSNRKEIDIKKTTQLGFTRSQFRLTSPDKKGGKRGSFISDISNEKFNQLDLHKTFSNFSGPDNDSKESLEKNKLSDISILKVTQLLETVRNYDFNIFELDEYIGKKIGFYVINTIFSNLDLDHLYDKEKFRNCITEITEGYNREIEYHNDIHATDVLQTGFVMINKGELKEKLSLQDVDIFAVLFAAFCHDFKHPGYNNIYLVNSKASLAIRYNGKGNLLCLRLLSS